MALALGKTLGEIDRLPVREFEQWWIYWICRPFGDVRSDMHFAQLIQAIVNMFARSPYSFADFMLQPDPLERDVAKQSPEEQVRILNSLRIFAGRHGDNNRQS